MLYFSKFLLVVNIAMVAKATIGAGNIVNARRREYRKRRGPGPRLLKV